MSADQEQSPESYRTANELARPWGYVTDQGQIWQKDFTLKKGKIVGQVFAGREEETFAKLVARFQALWKYYDELAAEAEQPEHKARFLTKIYELLEFIPAADALGDFDELLTKLHALRDSVEKELDENFATKIRICEQIEAWAQTDDWKVASEEVKELQEQFKESGPVSEVRDIEIWNRYRAAADRFYEARKQHYEELDQARQENLKLKEDLCAQAEELALSDDWKAAAEGIKQLQAQWKDVGPVPREKDDELWTRFRGACDGFFTRRQEYFQQKDRERLENLWKKEEICEEVEKLIALKSFQSARERIKELQQQWKETGPVPRDKDEELWNRFRTACDNYFQRD